MLVYRARHVLPIAAPPLVDGAVAVEEGKIVAVGPADRILAGEEEHEVRDLGDAVLLPGLVNAHTHLELSWMGQEPPPGGDFMKWLHGFIERRDREDPDVARQAAERAIESVVERGTVAVGDVANREWMPGLLARSPLWCIVFHELFGFPVAVAEKLLDEAASTLERMEADAEPSKGRVRLALTAHAPHTTSAALLKALAGRAAATGAPLSVHVAESGVETSFLAEGFEEYEALLKKRGQWDEHWVAPGQSPVDYLDRNHALSERTLAVHCVHLRQQDIQRLQARGATVVTCPRSNRTLGVGKAPVPKLLRAGIPVALGTDSLASAPDLDMFAELAALLQAHPELSPPAAMRMATLNGARALGLADRLGTIQPGKLTALIVVPLAEPEDDPWETLAGVPPSVLRLEQAPFAGQP